MLAMRDVVVRRADGLALAGTGLALAPGEVVALVGPNGAGKSTALKVLAGELRPDAGAVHLHDRPLSEWDPSALARVRAVLPQSSGLRFPFTVAEVIRLGRMPHEGHCGETVHRRVVRQALIAVGGGHLAERRYTALSGGEQQRVQLARVLAQIWDEGEGASGRYLLLDEPTASLDLAVQYRVLRQLRQLAGRGIGVLIVVHDLNLAARIADRVVLMADGRIEACGAPREVLSPERLMRVFEAPLHVSPGTGAQPPVIALDL